jgi:PAS domain S-box-containing protein
MDISLHTTIAGVATDAALFGVSTYAYTNARRLSAAIAPDREGLVVGFLFGLTAILAMLVPTALLPGSLADGAPIAVALAAPFGGFLAAIVAAVLAAAFRLWLGGASSLAGIAVILAAALIGVLLTELLRRGDTVRHRRNIVALALVLPAAAYIGLALRWPIMPGESAGPLALILGVGVFVSCGTLLFGAFLLHRLSIEDKLAESQRRVEALAANVPGVVFQCRVGRSGEILFSYLSPDCVDLFGVTPEEARRDSQSVLRLIHPEDRGAFTRSLSEAGGNLALWSHDFRIVDARGRIHWLHARATPRRLGDGEIAWHGALIEISRRKEREMAFRRIERLYRLLADNTTEIVQLTTPDGTRSYASPACRHALGYDSEELIGQPADALVHPEDAEVFRTARAQLAAGGKPCSISYRIRRKDGAYVPASETCRLGELGEDGRGREIVSVTRLSDERERADAVLEEAEARRASDAPFAKALEAIAAGVFITNPNEPGNPIIFANAAAAEITGYAVADLIGRSARVLEGPDSDRDTVSAVEQAIAEERRITVRILNYRRDGTPFWSSLHVSPIHSSAKRLQAFVAVFFDIGEHQGALSEALSREMAERAAGEFIADMSHELRTPLNGAIGFTDLLLEGELSPEQRRYATFVRDAGRSLLAILNNSLERAKVRAGFKGAESEFSVAKLALGCNAAVWYAAREKGLDLTFVMKPDVIDAVRGHPDRVRQVLLSLLGDAIKSTEKGSVVLSVAKAGDAPDGTMLRFAVTDSGPGMAPEKQRALPERAKSRGMGRGLALCRALVDEMGGHIGVNTPPQGGSEFWFTVPLGLADARAAKPAPNAASAKKGRILLAEDAPMNQELIVALLTKAGYEVEVVGDGLAAIEAAKRRSFDLLLLDLQMPRLDGFKAAEAIRALPEPLGKLPIIAITAKVLPRDVERCRAAGMNDHLAKPIEGAALLALIERWVGEKAKGRRLPQGTTAERAPLFNHAAFGRLETHLGVERAAEIADIVSKEIPERLERMLRQVSDRDRLSREAHELVSLAGNLGFADLALQCRRLMEAPGEADDWQVGVMVENAKSAAERAIAAMRRNDRPHASD